MPFKVNPPNRCAGGKLGCICLVCFFTQGGCGFHSLANHAFDQV